MGYRFLLAFLVFVSSFLPHIIIADTATPAGATNIYRHQDHHRLNLYNPRSLFMADSASHSMEVKAPTTLASDSILFIFPATNGTSGWPLVTDGSGATSWSLLARDKTATGTAYRILANNSTGVMSENAALTAAYPVITDANGQLATEQYLAKTRGGTGTTSTATYPASGTIVTRDATETLQNKSLNTTTTSIIDTSTPTKAIKFDASAITASKTVTITAGASTNDAAITLPAVSGTVTTLAGTEVITNKDINGGTASDTSRFTVPKNTKSNLDGLTRKEGTIAYGTDTTKLYVDNGSSLTAVGSGSGSGETNYNLNPDAEIDATGYAAYADAAGATPVNGTGGSPTVTITRQTSTILNGTASFKITKDAANRQGEGVSYDFVVPEGYRSKNTKIQFIYKTSANYVASDMGVYIYDKDTSTLITPQLAAIPAALSAGTFVTTWMLDTTASDDFRLILHIATTNANAYDVYFDDVIVGPGQLVQGFGTQSPSLAGFIQPYSGSIAGFSSVAGGDGTTLYYKDGWALCNGASISQTAYAQLYARVGTTHNSGTDPKTGSAFTTTSGYFRIPNLQGVFLRGVVDYSGSDAYSTDNDVDLGVYKIDKAQGHKHSIVLPNATAGGAAANPGAYFSSNYTDVTPNTTAPRGLVSGEMSNNGVDGAPRYAKETNPKQSGVYYLVKLYDDAASVYLGSGADNTAQMPLNWTAFTPSWTNFTAGNATQVAYYRRVNDQLEVYLKWVLGSSSSVTGTQYLTLPASLLADTNKLTASYDYLGEGKVYDASTGNQYVFKVVRNNTSTSQVFFEISYYGVNGIPISNSGSPVTWATSDEFTARFSVPIVNWTAQQYQGAMLAGFATAGVGTAGLVNNTAGNTAGTPIRGATDGSSATAGYVGEVKTAAANAVSTSAGSSSYVNATDGLTLTAGVWLVSYYQTAQIGSYPATDKGVKLNFDIATNGGTSIASQPNAAYVLKDSGGNVYPASSWTGSCGITTVVSISASTTYYGRISSTLISSDSSGYWTSVATATGGLVAVRIR